MNELNERDQEYIDEKEVFPEVEFQRKVVYEVIADGKKSKHEYEGFDPVDYAIKHKPEELFWKKKETISYEGCIKPKKEQEED